jgi:hypothetical protein
VTESRTAGPTPTRRPERHTVYDENDAAAVARTTRIGRSDARGRANPRPRTPPGERRPRELPPTPDMPTTCVILVLLLAAIALSEAVPRLTASRRSNLGGPTWTPGRLSVPVRTEAALVATRQLQQRGGRVLFGATPLLSACEVLSRELGVAVVPDWPALAEEGVSPATPVRADASGQRGEAVLKRFFGQFEGGVEWWVDECDGAVRVTSVAAADRRPRTIARVEVYDLLGTLGPRVLWNDSGRPTWNQTMAGPSGFEEDLVRLIKETVEPAEWQDSNHGAIGRIDVQGRRAGVIHTEAALASLTTLLEQLRGQTDRRAVQRLRAIVEPSNLY